MLFCPSLLAKLLLAGAGKGGKANSADGVLAAIAATFAAAAAKAETPVAHRGCAPGSCFVRVPTTKLD